MIFRSFCSKFQIWGTFSNPTCYSKNLPFTTSAIFLEKSANGQTISGLTPEGPERPSKRKENKGCCEKQNIKTLSNPLETPKNFQLEDEKVNKDSKHTVYEKNNKTLSPTKPKLQNSVSTNKNPANNVNISDTKRPTDLVSRAIEELAIKSGADWDEVRNFVLENEQNRGGKYTTHNLDANVLGYCIFIERFDLAFTYFKHISNKKIKPNLATLAKYLKVLYLKSLKNSKQDENEILALYTQIRREYPVLESSVLNALILAMSVTKEWRKTLDLMEELKKLEAPSKAAYSAIVAAMFSSKEEALAWPLLDEMLRNDKIPDSVAFISYLNSLKRLRKPENIIEKLEKMFIFFKNSEMKCSEDVAHQIMEICTKNFVGSASVKITSQGYCQNCKKKLENSEITENEFEQLRQKFMKNVILGKDLFLKTDPSELSKFKDFLEKMEKFDVVLDGLNIAYSTGHANPHIMAKLLSSVVRHYRENNKSVLVLGRVHMQNWPRNFWKYILENSSVFLTRNISQDDPYLLYCALNSGKDTIIVTRDLMRSHKFLLKDIKFKKLFQKWLDQRQHILLTIGKQDQPIFKKPPDFSPIAQKNGQTWHIPYESITEQNRTWLCLNMK